MKSVVKSEKEISRLKEGGKILAEALNKASEKAKKACDEKISTADLNEVAEIIIRKYKAEPSFLNYSENNSVPFPASLCTSINDEIVHGIPNKNRFLKEGDLIKLDLGVKYKKLFTDAAVTIPIGDVSELAKNILEVTKKGLALGLEQIQTGSYLGSYGNAVEKYVKMKGFYVVKGLVGHGVGYAVHEFPQIPNYGSPGEGLKLEEGMVLALEPMVNEKSGKIKLGRDGFAFVTKKGGLSAHFEHTVVVAKNGCELITEGIQDNVSFNI
jgi:methionyl aminopeptidase